MTEDGWGAPESTQLKGRAKDEKWSKSYKQSQAQSGVSAAKEEEHL